MFSNELSSVSTSANKNLSALIPLSLIAGVVLWEGLKEARAWWLEPWSFNQEDLKRYHALRKIYREMDSSLDLDKLTEWQLTEKNQPKFVLNYNKVQEEISTQINKLQANPTAINIASIGVLKPLLRYLESVSKRNKTVDKVTRAYERPDGVEAMFLVEFLSWFMTTVPTLPMLGEETLYAFQKRAEYCAAVKLQLSLPHWHNNHRANFSTMVDRLAKTMKAYYESLVQQSKMLGFHNLTEQLSNHLLSLNMQLIDIRYLLIEGAHSDFLEIEKFIKPAISDHKIIAQRNTGLGIWLYQTLQAAGIKNATYVSERTITLNEILEHLDKEHPDDDPCILNENLLEATSLAWGHWPFARTVLTKKNHAPVATTTASATPKSSWPSIFSKTEAQNVDHEETESSILIQEDKNQEMKAKKYLSAIREIDRQILWLSFLRKNVDRSQLVGAVFGEIWIYGNTTGKAVLDELLTTISRNLSSFEQKIAKFWDEYFEDHTEYSNDKNIAYITNDCHKHLSLIHTKNLPNFKKTLKSTGDIVVSIRSNTEKLPATLEKTKKIKKELMKDVLSIMAYYKEETKENYEKINTALLEFEQEEQEEQELGQILPIVEVVKTQPPSESNHSRLEAHTIRVKKSWLSFYDRVEQLLNLPRHELSKELSSLITFELISETTQFKSDFLQTIYLKYLAKHHDEVSHGFNITTNFAWWTHTYWATQFARTIEWEKIQVFRSTYCRVNAVYHLIYKAKSAPSEIEQLLIEAKVHKTIQKDFEKNHYYFSLIPRFNSIFCIEEQGEDICIRINPRMLKLGQGMIADQIKVLEKSIKDLTKERDEVKEELATTLEKLSEKDNELVLTKKELSSTKEELGSTKEELDSTKQELGSSKQELGSTKEELGSTKQELGSTKQELSSTKQELELTKDELIKVQNDANERMKEYQALLAQLQTTPGLTLFSTREKTELPKSEQNTMHQNNTLFG